MDRGNETRRPYHTHVDSWLPERGGGCGIKEYTVKCGKRRTAHNIGMGPDEDRSRARGWTAQDCTNQRKRREKDLSFTPKTSERADHATGKMDWRCGRERTPTQLLRWDRDRSITTHGETEELDRNELFVLIKDIPDGNPGLLDEVVSATQEEGTLQSRLDSHAANDVGRHRSSVNTFTRYRRNLSLIRSESTWREFLTDEIIKWKKSGNTNATIWEKLARQIDILTGARPGRIRVRLLEIISSGSIFIPGKTRYNHEALTVQETRRLVEYEARRGNLEMAAWIAATFETLSRTESITSNLREEISAIPCLGWNSYTIWTDSMKSYKSILIVLAKDGVSFWSCHWADAIYEFEKIKLYAVTLKQASQYVVRYREVLEGVSPEERPSDELIGRYFLRGIKVPRFRKRMEVALDSQEMSMKILTKTIMEQVSLVEDAQDDAKGYDDAKSTKKEPKDYHPGEKRRYRKETPDRSTKRRHRPATKDTKCYKCQGYGHYSYDCKGDAVKSKGEYLSRILLAGSATTTVQGIISVPLEIFSNETQKGGIKCKGILDTGASMSFIPQKIVDCLSDKPKLEEITRTIRLADGSERVSNSQVVLLIKLTNRTLGRPIFFWERLIVWDTGQDEIILGLSTILEKGLLDLLDMKRCIESMSEVDEGSDEQEGFRTGDQVPELREPVQIILDHYLDVMQDKSKTPKTVEEYEILLEKGKRFLTAERRRISPKHLQFVKEETDKLLEERVIEEAKAPAFSPIVIAPKKGNKWRLCVDYRRRKGPPDYMFPTPSQYRPYLFPCELTGRDCAICLESFDTSGENAYAVHKCKNCSSFMCHACFKEGLAKEKSTLDKIQGDYPTETYRGIILCDQIQTHEVQAPFVTGSIIQSSRHMAVVLSASTAYSRSKVEFFRKILLPRYPIPLTFRIFSDDCAFLIPSRIPISAAITSDDLIFAEDGKRRAPTDEMVKKEYSRLGLKENKELSEEEDDEESVTDGVEDESEETLNFPMERFKLMMRLQFRYFSKKKKKKKKRNGD
ncbi:hypothetical protein ADUPG1_011387 [Aduncisulcus paluster]|uniref:CCHC-type domain-containing protein n=1 Tax=Aduncisulcus paluster TaxID=2918883 RepID=A0ABQ5JVF6_9EUKA|nr:hypothetical protein ADUPG1_011387 [Aduncisulcus paluster]